MFNRVLNGPLVNLFRANDENNLGVVRLTHIMPKMLTLSKIFQQVGCKLSSCLQIATLCFGHAEHYIYCPSGRLYSSARMKNSRWKKSHNFQRLPLFSILYDDFLRFSKNRDKEFKLGPMYFNFPRTGN